MLQAHLRPAQPSVLLLHSRRQLRSSLHLHPLQSLQLGEGQQLINISEALQIGKMHFTSKEVCTFSD